MQSLREDQDGYNQVKKNCWQTKLLYKEDDKIAEEHSNGQMEVIEAEEQRLSTVKGLGER